MCSGESYELIDQCRILMWKLYLQRKRKWKGALCECIFPFFLLIIWSLISDQIIYHPAQIWDYNYMSALDNCEASSDWRSLAIVIGEEDYAQGSLEEKSKFKSWLNKKHFFPCDSNVRTFWWTMPNSTDSATIAAVTDYVKSVNYTSYPQIGMSVHIQSWESDYPEFTIRASSNFGDGMPSTKTNIQALSAASGSYSYQTWLIVMQRRVGEYFLDKVNSSLAAVEVAKSVSRMQFPVSPYFENTFISTIQSTVQWLVLTFFIYGYIGLVSSVVEDKQNRIKEGMKTFGMFPLSFWLSYFLMYTIIFTFQSIVCACVMKWRNMFVFTSPILIFLFFFLASCGIVTFGLLTSTFFENPKTATSISSLVLTATTVLFYAVQQDNVSFGLKALSSLLPTLCLCLQLKTITYYESFGTGLSWNQMGITVNNWNPTFGCFMFIIDAFFMLGLLIYLDKVMPKTIGTRKKFCFCLKPIMKIFRKRIPNPSLVQNLFEKPTSEFECDVSILVEEYTKLLSEQDTNKTGIVVKGLRKVYVGGGLQEQVIAVQHMKLHIFENHVTAILGHNGAGKTTLISMITGMLQPSSGTALIGDVDMAAEGFDDLRLKFGLCPQDSIVFPLLTVDEHLTFIAAIKKVSKQEAERQANELLEKIDLLDRRYHRAETLSGGEKRKLSVLMAMMGNPKFVFLDEPTAGMDPLSRRMTWKLIQDYKQGRTIILTTHFMDEADYLSDRIAIMANGQLRICGSSLFLKSQCGVGYTLSINTRASMEESEVFLDNGQPREKRVTPNLVLARVKAVVPVEVLTKEDTRLQLRISFAETDKFPELFDMLDQLSGEDNNWSRRSLTYALSVTTLDEVFVRIARDDIPGLKRRMTLSLNDLEIHSPTASLEGFDLTEDSSAIAEKPLIKESIKKLSFEIEESRMLESDNVFALRPKTEGYFFENLCALLQKRFRWTRWDYRAVYCQILAPLIFIIIGLVVVYVVKIPTQPSKAMVLNPLLYHGTTSVPVQPFDDSFLGTSQVTASPLPYNRTHNISQWLLDTASSTAPYRYAAFNFNGTESWILFANMTAIHSVPTFLLEYQNWKLRQWSSSSASMRVNMYPFPATSEDIKGVGVGMGITLGITFACGLALIPGQAVMLPIKERQVKAMHQQVISGVSLIAYWLANLIHDMILMLVPIICALILIQVFNTYSLKEGDNYGCVCLLFLLYGIAVHGLAYVISFLFTKPTSGQTCVLVLLLVSNVLIMVGIFLQLAKVKHWEIYVFLIRLLPSGCLVDGLIRITLKGFLVDLDMDLLQGKTYDLNITGYDIILLTCESFIYFGLAVCLEYAHSVPKFMKWATLEPRNIPVVQDLEDENVKEERADIQNNIREENTLILRGLRKVYRTGTSKPAVVAVNDLWFSVSEGEIFGFLGANGAGKSTSMLLLTGGGIVPTSGTASILGLDIMKDQAKLRRNFGFCPQSNALFDLLTGRQTLELYAKIKGISKENTSTMVQRMLETLLLKNYADQKVGTYSGGNKRKLCVAISLIGGPRIVFLDEPSAGVDPVARRWMWKFIQDNMSGRTVLLTTHAMDEAEHLCNRIGIMVNGQLRCIGTPEELKSKYVQGYLLECHPEEEGKDGDDNYVDIKHFIEETFPGSDILEEQSFSIKFRIPPGKPLGSIFKIIEAQKENLGIREYALSETNLEQVFLSFVEQQEAPELIA